MQIGATVVWCVTTCFGVCLLGAWLCHGGLRQPATRITFFPATLTFAHPVLAVTGLWLWVCFLITRRTADAWWGFAALSGSAMLGFVLLTRWLGRSGRHARGAEQRFPAKLAAAHGTVGLATFALVLIAATRATRG